MLRQVRVRLALRNDAFEIVLASKSKQSLAVCADVVAVKQPFTPLGHDRPKPELPVGQRQIPKVFAVAESARFFLVIGFGVLIPKNVEHDESRLCASEEQIKELRLALSVEANYFAVKDAAATHEVAS